MEGSKLERISLQDSRMRPFFLYNNFFNKSTPTLGYDVS